MKSMRWLSVVMLVIVIAGSLGGSAQAQTGFVGNGGTFPDEAFNNLQIEYDVTGAILTTRKDTYDFTTSRYYQGSLTGNKLAVTGQVIHLGGGYGLSWVASVTVDDVTVQETGKFDGADHKITNSYGPSIDIPKDAKSGSFRIEVTGYYSAGTRTLVVAGDLTRDWKGYPPPCNEVLGFYGEKFFEGYYTDQPGLVNAYPEWYSSQLLGGYDKYVAEGGTITAGTSQRDVADLPAALRASPVPTGFEDALRDAAIEQSKMTGPLDPGTLFYVALKTTGGNVRDALLAAHNILYRDGKKQNAAFVSNYLVKLRNPAGYSNTKKIPLGIGESSKMATVRNAVGDDDQGLWYHIFLLSALGLTDQNGYTPSALIEVGRAGYEEGLASDEFLWGEEFPRSKAGARYTDYIIYLEERLRRFKTGSAPDPDKLCVNYWSAAAGAELAKRVGTFKQKTVADPEAHHDGITKDPETTKTIAAQSPVSVDIYGVNGEYFGFNQEDQTFYGSTPEVLVNIIPEEDGTMAVFMTPFFEIDLVQVLGVGSGDVSLGVYDWSTNQGELYEFKIEPGQYASVHFNEDETSNVTHSSLGSIEPVDRVSIPRHRSGGGGWRGWLIALVVVGGLGAGGWMLYRRGVIRREWLQRIPLPRFLRKHAPSVVQAGAYCPQCGNPLAVGARFCGVCGLDMTPRPRFCPQCGEPLAEEARFCGKCGKEFIR